MLKSTPTENEYEHHAEPPDSHETRFLDWSG